MGARGWTVVAVIVGTCATAAGESQPTKIDIKAFRDELVVLQDREGGTYVVKPHIAAAGDKPSIAARIFYGTGKELYEQDNGSRGSDGTSWTQSTWGPRIASLQPATLQFKKDGSYEKSCGGKDVTALTQITGDKAKSIIDKSVFMTEYMMRRAHVLARDDAGVYYYVDRFAPRWGGKGYRVFVGKKGAMKLLPLTDIANDSAGEVFSTKTGDLRLTRTAGSPETRQVAWIRGEKRIDLISLDVDVNSTVIWTDLGIYKFLGTLCDNI